MLFHADRGEEKALNRTGLFLWKRLRRPGRLHELATEISAAFQAPSPGQVERDVERFLADLVREGFVQVRGDRGALHPPAQAIPGVEDAPRSMDIAITGQCNLRCPYCFYDHEMGSQPDLPTEEWLPFLEELGRLAVRDVCLSGGEPLVRPDLWEIVDGLIEHRLRYSLNTNGTRITEQVVAAFEEGKRRTRLDGIQVSIDGSCAGVNDRSRGRGAFDKTLHGMRLLVEAGFPVTARVTVNRYNAGDLENVARLLLEEVGISSFGTNDAMPAGAGFDNRNAIGLTSAQQLEAMRTLGRLEDRYPGQVTAMAGPLARRHLYRAMEEARFGNGSSPDPSMGYLTACGGVFQKLAVTHSGTIVPCVMLSGVRLGHIRTDAIGDIWTSHPALQALRNRRSIPLSRVPGCEECGWNQYCNGSCPGLAYEAFGDFERANPNDCYRRFLEAAPSLQRRTH